MHVAECVEQGIHVTNFCSISCWSNSEYWPQKQAQSGTLWKVNIKTEVQAILNIYSGSICYNISTLPQAGFLPLIARERLLEFYMRSNDPSHHGCIINYICVGHFFIFLFYRQRINWYIFFKGSLKFFP